MKITEKQQMQLLDYLDGAMGDHERAAFEQRLRTTPELAAFCRELQAAEASARADGLQTPSRNFTAIVMANLHRNTARPTPSVYNSLLLVGGILVLVALSAILLSTGIFDQSATIEIQHPEIVKEYLKAPLPSIGVDGKVVVNIIIFLNLAIALIVLDRSVLKPFFQRRVGPGI
ncbi:MAG TPA: hypothetical protein VEB86_09625 [Chryseosolibacter sp.]|nr:hypothetical protein [Chryseosolibacter sp.]